jgi:hypothetical protein
MATRNFENASNKSALLAANVALKTAISSHGDKSPEAASAKRALDEQVSIARKELGC